MAMSRSPLGRLPAEAIRCMQLAMSASEPPGELRRVVASAGIQGETPRWCERTQGLWWLDPGNGLPEPRSAG